MALSGRDGIHRRGKAIRRDLSGIRTEGQAKLRVGKVLLTLVRLSLGGQVGLRWSGCP